LSAPDAVGIAPRRRPAPPQHGASAEEHTPMLDVIMLAVGLGFFALSVAYVYACERL
jgi:hypothetical protein